TGKHENDWNGACLLLHHLGRHFGTHNNHVRPQLGQLPCQHTHPIDIARRPTDIDTQVTPLDPTQFGKSLREQRVLYLCIGVIPTPWPEHAEEPCLLSARRERPRCRRAAEKSDEVAPPCSRCHLALPREGNLANEATVSCRDRAVCDLTSHPRGPS